MTIGAAQQFFLGASKATGGGGAGYQIERSLRFNSSDSASLSRTPAVAGNRKTFTWGAWVKRASIGSSYEILFSARAGTSSNRDYLTFQNDQLVLYCANSSGITTANVQTTALFRDPSAWYHLLLAVDTTQATAANRVRIYVNGTEITVFSLASYPSQNTDLSYNDAQPHTIGQSAAGTAFGFNGYLADIDFIDGQALTPSSFTEVSATTGQLVPKAYTGSFGTNGFWLKFSDNSAATATTIGKDYSGNGNNWTPNNLSVTAGSGNDSLVDTPTSYGTDTYVGGEVRGNYPTLNPLSLRPGAALSNGNLDLSATPQGGTWYSQGSTMGVSSGSFYWEVTLVSGLTSSEHVSIGIASFDTDLTGYHYPGYTAFSYGYTQAAVKVNNNSGSSYGATYTNGDVIGISLNMSTGALVFYKNGTSQGTAFTVDTTKTYQLILGYAGTTPVKVLAVNFGQRPFAFPVSGFKALCDTNLPAPVVAKPNTVFDAVPYTGSSGSQSITTNFSPDLVWVKTRNAVTDHEIYDIVRGAGVRLSSNNTLAENSLGANGLSSFNSNGFTVPSTANYGINGSGYTYAAWAWDAGSSTVSNPDGSITSQVRANASAGFSVVTYTGTLSGNGNATVGHGLGVAPQLVITKARSAASRWAVQMPTALSANNYLELNTTSAQSSWGTQTRANPTSIVFDTIYAGGVNESGVTYVAYCFAPVTGYSSMGSYVGNGSASDGPFVFCNFRPRWVLVKSTGSAENWFLLDSARNTYNAVNSYLMPNSSSAEDPNNSTVNTDFLSNGFKLRASTSALNSNGVTYIYCAFAESPFQYARAR